MSLVNYDAAGSDDEGENDEQQQNGSATVIVRQLRLPTPLTTDDNERNQRVEVSTSSTLLANLPKPFEHAAVFNQKTIEEFPEDELEDIVRSENKTYAKNLPEVSKTIKRKRDGPVKIFLPTVEQDSDEEDRPKRKGNTEKRGCPLLNVLPAPVHEEEGTTVTKAPQVSSTGLFIPYTLTKKNVGKTSSSTDEPPRTTARSNRDDDDEDDDETSQSDFLGLNKSDQIKVSHVDVESVLRETLPKARVAAPPQAPVITPIIQEDAPNFDDLDEINPVKQTTGTLDDDDELLRYLPKSERYREIKHVHIDSMMSEGARIQLLKNASEEREAMKAQAAIHVPKGEVKKRAHLTYLIAKAQSEDLKLKNMWSEQKLTKRQTQAKYGF